MHVVELKNQRCEVFYDKLKFIYLELPKFTKTLEQLDNHFDKWLFLLKHLYELEERPEVLQEGVFGRLFEVAEIAQFSRTERESYENSLKYYRDLKNVVDTSREEGIEEGIEIGREEGIEIGREEEAIALIMRQLTRRLNPEPSEAMRSRLSTLPLPILEDLSEALLDFSTVSDLEGWLQARC